MGKFSKKFSFSIPQNYTDPISQKVTPVGTLNVDAIGYKHTDGSFRSVDINTITWCGAQDSADITTYLSACDPDKWDELMAAAENNFKNLYVTVEESASYNSDGE